MSTCTSVLPVWVLSTSPKSDPESWLCLHITAVYLLLYSQNMCGKRVIQTGFKMEPLGRSVSALNYQTTVHMWLQDKELVKGVTLPSHCTNSLWVRRMCWNFLGQTTMSKGEGFLTFQTLPLSSSSRCCWWFGRTSTSFGSTKPPATPCRWGHSQSLKCQKTFTSWHSCQPENISLNSVTMKASRLVRRMSVSYWTPDG